MSHHPHTYRPVVVDVPSGIHAGTYELHLGRPGAPRVYRRLGNQGLRRVIDPAVHDAVARAYGYARAAARREIARRQRRPYRFGQWLSGLIARCLRAIGRAWRAVRWQRRSS